MTDNATRKRTLEALDAAGWRIGTVSGLLELDPADEQIIEAALRLKWNVGLPTTEDIALARKTLADDPELQARIRELDSLGVS